MTHQTAPWWLTLVLLLVLAVTLGVGVGEREPSQAWVKVWGGPTEGPAPLNLRLELIDDSPDRLLTSTAGIALRVEAEGTEPLTLPLSFDDQGTTYVRIAERYRHPSLMITRGKQWLARGVVHLDRSGFWQRRRVRDGWFHGKSVGSWTIRVGCREGALALGHAGRLGIMLTDLEGRPLRSRLEFEFDGLDADSTVVSTGVVTDELGRASVAVVPKDLSASLQIGAFDGQKRMASYFAAVPIASTALVGSVKHAEVMIDSGIPLPRVYYALVNEQGLWANGAIAGSAESSKPERRSLRVTPMPDSPAWLMLGTEPSLDGPNVIGWPVLVPESTFVPETVVVNEQLLLDGKPQVLAEAAGRRRARFHRALVGLGIALFVVVTAVVVPLLRSHGKATRLLDQLPRSEVRGLLDRRVPSALLVIVLIVLGLAALLVWIRATLLDG